MDFFVWFQRSLELFSILFHTFIIFKSVSTFFAKNHIIPSIEYVKKKSLTNKKPQKLKWLKMLLHFFLKNSQILKWTFAGKKIYQKAHINFSKKSCLSLQFIYRNLNCNFLFRLMYVRRHWESSTTASGMLRPSQRAWYPKLCMPWYGRTGRAPVHRIEYRKMWSNYIRN